DEAQASALDQQIRQAGDERCAIAWMGRSGALERRLADHEAGARKQEPWRLSRFVRCEEASRVIEMEMAQDDDVDVGIVEPAGAQRLEQHVTLLEHSVAFPELRLEEGTDPGLDEDALRAVLHQERAAGERDPSELVGRSPPAPEGARRIAEHRAPVEAL